MSEAAVEYKRVNVQSVKKAGQHAAFLLAMADKMDASELIELGVDPEAIADLRDVTTEIEREIPRARDLMLSALSQGVGRDLALMLHHRAVVSMHALAPLVALRLADKVDDAMAPGSTRVMLEIAKGIGLLQPAEPVSQGKRMAQLDLAELKKKPVEDLKKELLRSSTP